MLKEVAQWKQTKPLPRTFGDLEIMACDPGAFTECDIVFSGLDSSVAGEIGMHLLQYPFCGN